MVSVGSTIVFFSGRASYNGGSTVRETMTLAGVGMVKR